MVPVIAGIPAEHIEDAILSYVDGARSCAHEPRMCETVAMLSESQVTEVADYYAGKERGSSGQEFDRDLAARGALLYQQHCALCHVSPDSEDAAYAVGIPLHGQRLDYLRYAIEAYLGGDREAQFEAMMHELRELRPDDVDALVNYFASYRPGGIVLPVRAPGQLPLCGEVPMPIDHACAGNQFPDCMIESQVLPEVVIGLLCG